MLLTLITTLAPAMPIEVHVVDTLGLGTHTELQAAVDEAADGDTILVRVARGAEDTYPGITIDGKSLTIYGHQDRSTADQTLAPAVRIGESTVQNLSYGQTVTIRDLQIGRPEINTGSMTGLRVHDCVGAVRLEGVTIRCAFNSPLSALEPLRAQDISLHGSRILGGYGPAVRAVGSRLAFYDCSILGGAGFDAVGFGPNGTDGGDALELVDRSFAWLGRTEAVGGRGGNMECPIFTTCSGSTGDGGNGAVIEAASLCVQLEATIEGGPEGEAFNGFDNQIGAPGEAIVGSVFEVPGQHRILTSPRAVASGEQVDIEVEGAPGEEVTLTIGDVGGHRYLGWRKGVLLVNGGLVQLPQVIGVIPASGVLQASIDLPAARSGEARTLSMQGTLRSGPTRFRLTPVRQITVQGDGLVPFEPGGVVYVDGDAPAGGNGRSWGMAVRTLAEGVASIAPSAEVPTELWIAEGTYYVAPTTAPLSRDPLSLYGSVTMFGGFDGTETSAADRDPALHPVIIDGDVAQNDFLGFGANLENSKGLFDVSGAGPFDVTFDSVTLTRANGQAAIASDDKNLTMRRCIVRDNESMETAGGVYSRPLSGAGTVRITQSHFYANRGGFAGAVYYRANGLIPADRVLRIESSILTGNIAAETFDPNGRNIAFGGAVTAIGPTVQAEIVNCTLFANDVLVAGSRALALGGVHVEPGAAVTFHNNICWSTGSAAGMLTDSTIDPLNGASVGHNNVSQLLAGWDGLGNVSGPPAFVDMLGADGREGTGDEDLRVAAGSPCIDAGDNDSVPADLLVDFDGNARIQDDPNAPDTGNGTGPLVDIGAYER